MPYLGAPAIALVGSYDEVTEGILEFTKVGVTQFLFLGWPDLAEMKAFYEEVRPRVLAEYQISSEPSRGVLLNPEAERNRS